MKKSEVRKMIKEEILKKALSEIDVPEMTKTAKKHGFKIKLDSKRKVGSSYVWDFDVLNNKVNRIKIANAGGKADMANVYSGESTKNGIVFKNYDDLFSQMKKLKENKMKKSEVREMIIEELEELREADFSELVKLVKDIESKLKKYKITDKKKAKEAEDALVQLNAVLNSI